MTRPGLTQGDAVQRARTAWALRVEGHPWHYIAEQAGYSDGSTAYKAVTRFRDGVIPAIDATVIRHELLERGEWLWQQAAAEVVEGRPGAVTAAVRVLDRIARLTGSDAPSKIAVGHLESVVAEMYAERDEPVALPSMPAAIEVISRDG